MRTSIRPEHRCRGYPEGFQCLVDLTGDWIYCRGCRERRQEELAAGIKDLPKDCVGIQVSDFSALHLVCECGGDPTANLHTLTLHHRRWEWEVKGLNKPPVARKEAFTAKASAGNMGAGRLGRVRHHPPKPS